MEKQKDIKINKKKKDDNGYFSVFGCKTETETWKGAQRLKNKEQSLSW